MFGRATLLGKGGDWVAVQPGGIADLTAGSYLHATTDHGSLGIKVPGADSAPASVTVQGGSAWVEAGAGRGIHIETGAEPGGTAVTVDGSSSEIYSYGADTIRTGAGTATVRLCADTGDVWGGSGQLTVTNCDGTAGSRHTVHGGDGTVTVQGTGTDLTFVGGAGDAILDGGGRSLTIQGGSGRITVVNPWALGLAYTGGTGDALLNVTGAGGTVTFGTGNTVVHELDWSAPVTYTVTAAGTGTQTISGFRPGTDILRLDGTGVAQISSADNGTTLVTTAGARVLLQGVMGPVSPVILVAPDQPVPTGGASVAPTPAQPAPVSATPDPVQPILPAPALEAPAVAPPAAGDSQGNAPARDAAPAPAEVAPAPAVPPVAAAPTAQPAPTPDPVVVPQPLPAVLPSEVTDPASPAGTAATGGVPVPRAAPVPDAASAVANPPASPAPAPAQPAPAQPHAALAAPAFNVIQTATGQAANSDGDAYTGPVASLQRQYI